MKMNYGICGLVMLAFVSFAIHAEELKIGYIDMQKAIQATSAGKKAKRGGGVANRWRQAVFRGHGTGTIYLSPTTISELFMSLVTMGDK